MINKKGFTLLEVIIAVFFISVALVAIIELFNVDVNSADNSREYLKALTQAQAVMEELSSRPYGLVVDNLPVVEVNGDALSKSVTVNVKWSSLKSSGTIVLVKEFYSY